MKGEGILDNENNLRNRDRCLVDILVESAYFILSGYKLGIRKSTGDILIRPHEARYLLSNKMRITKPVIRLIIYAMKHRGIAERNNQYIVLKANNRSDYFS
jgi:hypothetical protein